MQRTRFQNASARNGTLGSARKIAANYLHFVSKARARVCTLIVDRDTKGGGEGGERRTSFFLLFPSSMHFYVNNQFRNRIDRCVSHWSVEGKLCINIEKKKKKKKKRKRRNMSYSEQVCTTPIERRRACNATPVSIHVNLLTRKSSVLGDHCSDDVTMWRTSHF